MSARFLVIGAGLGGLTAALALRRAGFEVEIHEAAPALGEIGAGLTLSRGAQHVFRDLGLQDQLAAFATPSTAFPFVHYRAGRLLAGCIAKDNGLPDDGVADIARQCHRADLHAVLAGAAGDIKLGHRLVAIEQTSSGVSARFANGDKASGDALIGADGVRSAVRPLLWNDGAPRFTGQIAYRFLIKRDTAAPFLEHGRGAVFVGPGATFNRYALRGGSIINCVGIVATSEWVGEGWQTPAERSEILLAFEDWHPQVKGIAAKAEHAIKWGLFDRVPLERWSAGSVTLLGDAAHAMLPFLGMGAAMAIEDAMILARALASEGSVVAGFDRYERARRPRTALLHRKSVEQGALAQARNPDEYDHGSAPAADPEILDFNPVSAPI